MAKRILLYILYFLILAGLVVAIVLTFASKGDDPKPKATPQSSSNQQKAKQQAQAPKTSSSSEPNNSKQDKPKTTTPATPAPASTPPTSTSTSQLPANNQALANTGPGETIALFAGVTLVAGVGYSIRQRRRLVAIATK